jgi:hypothetical protein
VRRSIDELILSLKKAYAISMVVVTPGSQRLIADRMLQSTAATSSRSARELTASTNARASVSGPRAEPQVEDELNYLRC